jgi:hypothetical protein
LYQVTCVPDFDPVIRRPRDNQSPVRRELDGADGLAVRARLLTLQLQRCSCKGWQDRGQQVRRGGGATKASAPSQTLIVPEPSPETILDPSGEKSTLKALNPASIDPTSFRDAENKGWTRVLSRGQGKANWGLRRTCIPDFDGLVVRSGHNLRAIEREGNRIYCSALDIVLLNQESQGTCQRSQEASTLAKEK